MHADFTGDILRKQKLMHLFKRFFQVLFGEDFATNKVTEDTPSSIALALHRDIDVIIVVFIILDFEQFILCGGSSVNGFRPWLGE